MTHHHVDGTLVVAKLKRGVWRGGIYRDVTVRTEDGCHGSIGTLFATDDLRHAMVPGARGRFYFYDVMGSKGVHGFRPIGGKAHARFPTRFTILLGVIGFLNLLTAVGWWLLDGSFATFAASFGLLGLIMSAMFITTAQGAMRAYRADDPKAPTPAELAAAGARA